MRVLFAKICMEHPQLLVLDEPTNHLAGMGSFKQTVTVHCLAGSSFELEVESADTGWEVAGRIAAGVGHPAGLVVLTSGGCVIDQSQLLVDQVQHDKIWHVVRRLGAGRVATLYASTRGIQLPSSLQSLFGYQFNHTLEGIQLPSSLRLSQAALKADLFQPWERGTLPLVGDSALGHASESPRHVPSDVINLRSHSDGGQV
ncbi:ABCF3 [Symbiodinium sp. KB8]|nr:ABCF3 [Symbiodinium sp. KB8]